MEQNYQLILNSMKNWISNYRTFVKQNPLLASEIESSLRWISYLTTATKVSNSHIISELLYSASSLLTLLNDAILRKAADIQLNPNVIVEKLQTFLSIIEYSSVFSEFASLRLYGEFGRWTVIAVIQLTKAIIRLTLLLKYNQGMQRNLPIVPLDRTKDLTQSFASNGPLSGAGDVQITSGIEECESMDNSTFTLKRSGRLMRTIDNAPPRTQRTWMSPHETVTVRQFLEKQKKNAAPSPLNDYQLIGEVLHIIRPVAHLVTVAGFGPNAWIPYLVALGLDASSLKLLSDPPNKLWNVNERIELGQRSFALLLYLLRSPFYDRFTKDRILRTLRFFSDHIPLFGRLITPLINYLPEWQKTYFYVWGV